MMSKQDTPFLSVFHLQEKKKLKQREQLYAEGFNLSKLVDKLIIQLKEQNGLTMINIAKNFNVTDKQLRAWRKGRSAIPLNVLEKLSDELNWELSEIESYIDHISSSKGKKITIPKKMTPKLIEILGRFCGDGSCGIYGQPDNKYDYKFSFKENELEFVKIHAEDMNNLFGIKGTVIHYNNYAENVIRSKPLVLFFMNIFEFKDNFNKSRDGKPPSKLKTIPWSKRKFFTTGLIDTEGCFFESRNNSIFFTIKMINKNYIDEIRDIITD